MRRALPLALALALAACSLARPLRPSAVDEATRKVAEAEVQLRTGAFPAAARLFEEVTRQAPDAPTHARALYGLARLLVQPDNTGRDYRRALQHFDRLLREHPQGAHAVEARAWRALLAAYLARADELERLKQIDLELERRKTP